MYMPQKQAYPFLPARQEHRRLESRTAHQRWHGDDIDEEWLLQPCIPVNTPYCCSKQSHGHRPNASNRAPTRCGMTSGRRRRRASRLRRQTGSGTSACASSSVREGAASEWPTPTDAPAVPRRERRAQARPQHLSVPCAAVRWTSCCSATTDAVEFCLR